jgi:hypothetical protein
MIKQKTVFEAYKALKQNVYYDKSNTNLTLRNSIAEFEYCEKIENYQSNLETKLDDLTNAINGKNNEYFEELYNKISLIKTPKKFERVSEKDINSNKTEEYIKKENENFISNETIFDNYEIKRLFVFIDCPIELQIMNILWIYEIGYKLDKSLSNKCYGNRLNFDNETGKLNNFSLFKAYYYQYEKWRDDAITTAKFIIEKQKSDVAILTMDIKDYYYSVSIDKAELKKELKLSKDDKFVHGVFEKVHTKYTEQIKEFNYPKDKIKNLDIVNYFSLPIGLPSSYILANWYLQKFDKIIIEKIKPHYYGRYVDDMIFVLSNPTMVEEAFCCETLNCIKTEYKDAKSKIAHFVGNHLHEGINFGIVEDTEHFEIKQDPENYEKSVEPKLIVQKEKVFLYYFKKDESLSVLEKLKRDIDIASSEFRFFSDCNPSNFEDKVYELIYDGSSRKIITLKDYKINSYGLSVFLAKKIYNIQNYSEADNLDLKKISLFFQGRNLLDYSNHWEKVLTYFMFLKKKDEIKRFLKKVIEEIGKYNFKKGKSKKALSKPVLNSINEIKFQMLMKLYRSFILALALNPTLFDEKEKEKIQDYFVKKELQIQKREKRNTANTFRIDIDTLKYRFSNMVRHNYITTPLLNFTTSYFDNSDTNLIERNSSKVVAFNNNPELSDPLQKFSPRLFSFAELSVFHLFKNTNDLFINSKVFSGVSSNPAKLFKFLKDNHYAKKIELPEPKKEKQIFLYDFSTGGGSKNER